MNDKMDRDEELLRNSHERAEYDAGFQRAIDALRARKATFEERDAYIPASSWADYLEQERKEQYEIDNPPYKVAEHSKPFITLGEYEARRANEN